MNVVFLTNCFNHHQAALSNAFHAMKDVCYTMIETEMMTAERKNMGWAIEEKPDYVVDQETFLKNKERFQRLIDTADVVIIGNAPVEFIKKRLKRGTLTFVYSERIYKKKYERYKFPIRYFRFWRKYGRYKNVYLLCASAYAAADFAKTLTFLKKAYKWGYFPAFFRYVDIDLLLAQKKENTILWVARMISLKHPEAAVEVAKRLKEEGYRFELNMIGNGALEGTVRESINQAGLDDCVKMLGAMMPQQVREHMEHSEIFLFTSDRNEGWGAVLNESMNSACAVVASHAIGSVPFLVRDGENGLIYQDGDVEALYRKVRWLIEHPRERKQMAKHAYETLAREWNAEQAVKRFIAMVEQIISGNKRPDLFRDGPCSKARIIRDDWYQET